MLFLKTNKQTDDKKKKKKKKHTYCFHSSFAPRLHTSGRVCGPQGWPCWPTDTARNEKPELDQVDDGRHAELDGIQQMDEPLGAKTTN